MGIICRNGYQREGSGKIRRTDSRLQCASDLREIWRHCSILGPVTRTSLIKCLSSIRKRLDVVQGQSAQFPTRA